MIYSTHKRKHRKTGKHYKNMRGGNNNGFVKNNLEPINDDYFLQYGFLWNLVGAVGIVCLLYFGKIHHSSNI